MKKLGILALVGVGIGMYFLSTNQVKTQTTVSDKKLTINEVINSFGLDPTEKNIASIYTLIQEGSIKTINIDGEVYVMQSELDRYFLSTQGRLS